MQVEKWKEKCFIKFWIITFPRKINSFNASSVIDMVIKITKTRRFEHINNFFKKEWQETVAVRRPKILLTVDFKEMRKNSLIFYKAAYLIQAPLFMFDSLFAKCLIRKNRLKNLTCHFERHTARTKTELQTENHCCGR